MFEWHNTPSMWLSMLVVWVLFAAAAYYLLRGRWTTPPSEPRATEILEQRFARGEISVEEFDERREALVGAATSDSKR